MDNPGFGAVIFRRTGPQITNEGGLWDESVKMYSQMGAKPIAHKTTWRFPSGAKIKFSHMEHEKNREDWQGAQIPFIGFDELTHFTKLQFTYMFSRNRSVCGVAPYIRGTCNPSSKSWVRELIDWWIGPDGYAIPERSGVIRYFVVLEGTFHWGDSKEELIEKFGPESEPKSFTFIRSSLEDNKILMEADPGYRANLMALPLIEREQLLNGNWNISADGGIIRPEWIRYYDTLPDEVISYTWSFDTAVKEKSQNDFSVGQLWAECKNGYYLVSQWRDKVPYPALKKKVKELTELWPAREVLIEDKQSGQQLIQDLRDSTKLPIVAMMPGRNMALQKVERANFVSTQFECGNVFVPTGCAWVREMVQEWGAFPNSPHDDQVDTMTQYLSRMIKTKNTGVIPYAVPITTGGKMSEYSNADHQEFRFPFR